MLCCTFSFRSLHTSKQKPILTNYVCQFTRIPSVIPRGSLAFALDSNAGCNMETREKLIVSLIDSMSMISTTLLQWRSNFSGDCGFWMGELGLL